ncbi:MAG: NAD+ synthase [Actinobacteria bacterium]|nr:NAD+ synthase [Actinomycetota bacterium]
MRTIRVAMAQINPVVGDLKGNKEKILDFVGRAKKLNVDILTFPELAITGYPPEDLLLKPHFVRDNQEILSEIVKEVNKIAVIIGFVDSDENGDLYNAAALVHNRELRGIYRKILLPNYGVFDEKRYFKSGPHHLIFVLNGTTFGINICEDIWFADGPAKAQVKKGRAEIILNISSSPYHAGKGIKREEMLKERAVQNKAIICYNNLVGGQDELIFDGQGLIFDNKGNVVARGEAFKEDLIVADLNPEEVFTERLTDSDFYQEAEIDDLSIKKVVLSEIKSSGPKPLLPVKEVRRMGRTEEIYNALILGVRDYIGKNGFKKTVIGLSGGIDSALVAVIAVDALGRENVVCVSMPSVYSSTETQYDAKVLADNLGVEFITIPINDIYKGYIETLKIQFKGLKENIAEENIQARIRGNILMALSNKYGWLVLSTGNKSEMSVGYATLYGDMAGGLAVIKDVPKTYVYELANYRNATQGSYLIPESILKREPSAELKPDQKDTDTLPPYSVLDPILESYIEEDKSFDDILRMGYEKEIIEKVISMVDRSEYKRRQSPPGIKITPKAFGKDRRIPITNRYRDY